MLKRTILLAAVTLALAPLSAIADPVKVVAAENFYGDVASQIGGGDVAVTSILTNPDQDPHLFEASTATARALADAKVVVSNGVDYDPWMEKLLSANNAAGRKEIVVAALVGRKAGDNPHLWYDPAYMKAAAKAIAAALAEVDPARKGDYEKGEAAFVASLAPLNAKIAEMKKKYAGEPVTLSEPVFGYQAGLIGLKVRNEGFALAVMNNTEPSASQVAGFENDLKKHLVKAMLFNAQASEPAVQRLVEMAKANKIPIVGVSETEPPGMTYQAWMLAQLDALDKALSGATEVSALRFDNVVLRLGGRNVLSGASFAVEEGEFIGVLGANGAGKTTMMRAALGLLAPSAGRIEVFGKPAAKGASNVGYMPQNRGAVGSLRLTGYDIVVSAAMGGRFGFRRLDKSVRAEVARVLELVGARELAARPIDELSGGERQRLLLSQALIGRPRLLLLDEPLISLDPAHQASVVDIARRLRDELKIAILFSAHELNPLVNTIDRVLYLGSGAAVIGTVDEVVTGPVLSRLYGAEIEVVRVKNRIFVMAGEVEVEREAHRHEEHDHAHGHAHGHAHV